MSKKLIEDLEKAGVQHLDDVELEQINGGYENFCWWDYCCVTVVMHPSEQDTDNYCLADYKCGFAYHTCFMDYL